jgi:hypothetical protein
MAKLKKVKLSMDAVRRIKKKKPTKSPRTKPNRPKQKRYRGQGRV